MLIVKRRFEFFESSANKKVIMLILNS